MKYAPANANGEKPYVVEVVEWGRVRSKVVWATTPARARYKAVGRRSPGVYARSVRRALTTETPSPETNG